MLRGERQALKIILTGCLIVTLFAIPTRASGQFEGDGRIISGRASVRTPLFYPNTSAGPVLVQLPGLGEFFAAYCPVDTRVADASIAFRNSTRDTVEAYGPFFSPDPSLFPPGSYEVIDVAPLPVSLQLGAGEGRKRVVATVTLSTTFDASTGTCTYNVQATYQAAGVQ